MVVVHDHFHPWDMCHCGSTRPVLERGASPEASGLVRQVRTHGPSCLVSQYTVTYNHVDICLDTVEVPQLRGTGILLDRHLYHFVIAPKLILQS